MDARSKTFAVATAADDGGVRARHPTASSGQEVTSKASKGEDASVTTRATMPASPASTLLHAALSALAFAFGVLTLGFFSLRAVAANYGSEKPSRGFWERVEGRREGLWSLDGSDRDAKGEQRGNKDSFTHAFADVAVDLPSDASGNSSKHESSIRMHYLINRPLRNTSPASSAPTNPPNDFLIFIHGWPDSCQEWRPVMQTLLTNHTPSSSTSNGPASSVSQPMLIALDLPGHGGSQGLQRYGPDEVLECVFRFVCLMRERYASKGGRVILVGHDWGAAICARLAAEAPECMDEVVMTNGPISAHALATASHHLNLTQTRLRALSFLPAVTSFLPVLRQLISSSYAFVYNLPVPVLAPLATLGDAWWLRLVASIATGSAEWGIGGAIVRAEGEETVGYLAGLLGPGVSVAGSGEGSDGYHKSVHERAKSPQHRFIESIRLYREGLASYPWTQSPSTLSLRASLRSPAPQQTAISHQSLNPPPGALQRPMTMFWSLNDPALTAGMCVDGIEKYVCRGSMVIRARMKDVGHWTPVQAVREVAGVVKLVLETEGRERVEGARDLVDAISVKEEEMGTVSAW